jgi:hypothetical protein
VIIVIAGAALALACVVATFLLVRFAGSLDNTRHRFVLVLLVILAALYFVPKVIQATSGAYRTGLKSANDKGGSAHNGRARRTRASA